MASAPGHPFWLNVLEEIFAKNGQCGDDPVLCTGPRLVDKFSLAQQGCGAFGCVVRLPYDVWYPEIAHWNSNAMKDACHHSSAFAERLENSKIHTKLKKACHQFEHVND